MPVALFIPMDFSFNPFILCSIKPNTCSTGIPNKFISIQEKSIDFYNNKLSVIGLKLKPEYLF